MGVRVEPASTRGDWGVLVSTSRHAEVAGQVFAKLPHLAGNLLHDSHTAILMREHGIGGSTPGTPTSIDFPFSR